MPPPLTTERLTLLPYSLATEAHLDGLVAAWDDPEVWRYVGAGRDGFCRADLDRALERAKERGLLDGELLVVRTSDGAVLGACGLYPSWLDGGLPDETDLGYRFGRAFWARARATGWRRRPRSCAGERRSEASTGSAAMRSLSTWPVTRSCSALVSRSAKHDRFRPIRRVPRTGTSGPCRSRRTGRDNKVEFRGRVPHPARGATVLHAVATADRQDAPAPAPSPTRASPPHHHDPAARLSAKPNPKRHVARLRVLRLQLVGQLALVRSGPRA